MANKTSKKLTSDELNKFKNFIAKRQQLLSDLGSIELQLDTLSKQKESIFNGIQKLSVLESEFTQELTTKYGKVSVDMNTGEITSEL
jgi:hypothetical protein|tara:strand:- start:1086 stop:1346 length:261 start_codon:yes stop_codon:yes gene_type:complete